MGNRFLLWLWFALGFLFIERYLNRTAARHLYLILPPAVLLFTVLLEETSFFQNAGRVVLTLGMIFAGSLSLAYTDFLQSSINRRVAEEIGQWQNSSGSPEKPSGLYYWGNDFMGYSHYLKKMGWKPYDQNNPPKPGDWIIFPWLYNTKGSWKNLSSLTVLRYFDYQSPWPIRVLAPESSAGFHSSSWGAMPFAFSPGWIERFSVCRVEKSR